MSYRDIANAFVPNEAIDDPGRFAGRHDQVRALTHALHEDSSVPLVYGDRGLGKSSLARQVARIARGGRELLEELELPDLCLGDDEIYIVFKVECVSDMGGFDEVLQLLVNRMVAFANETGLDRQVTSGKSTELLIGAPGISTKSTREYKSRLEKIARSRSTVGEEFVGIAELIGEWYQRRLLFIVDEFDKLPTSQGAAEFIRSTSNQAIKFLIVGIASSHSTLLVGHHSILRQLKAVEVPRMREDELQDIIERVEGYLAERGILLRFSASAKKLLVSNATGFPWFIHVIGRSALTETHEDGRTFVESADVERAVEGLVSNAMAQHYQDQYLQAVRASVPREKLLRSLARVEERDVPTKKIYAKLRVDGVVQASVYLGHLLSEQYGAVVHRPEFQTRGIVRFSDEMFKQYVRMRQAINYPETKGAKNMLSSLTNRWRPDAGTIDVAKLLAAYEEMPRKGARRISEDVVDDWDDFIEDL